MGSKTEKKRTKIKKIHLSFLLWAIRSSPTGNSRRRCETRLRESPVGQGSWNYYPPILPSITGWWLAPGDYLPSTSTLPRMQMRKSKAKLQVLARHFTHGLEWWVSQVPAAKSISKAHMPDNLDCIFVTVSLQSSSAL